MSDVSNLYESGDGDVVVNVHVSPGAGRSAVVGRHGDALKIRVAAPPVEGRANEAAAALLAETFDVKDKDVTLVSGDTSRTKRFRLAGAEVDEIVRRLRLLVGQEQRPRRT